uniref:Uncharacterized protein n=1 Tax=Arundo donax TaxID=35708 RepID=A0A0A9FP09_ARUDO
MSIFKKDPNRLGISLWVTTGKSFVCHVKEWEMLLHLKNIEQDAGPSLQKSIQGKSIVHFYAFLYLELIRYLSPLFL